MKLSRILLFLISFCLVNCHDEELKLKPKSGYFTLTPMTLSSGRVGSATSIVSEFNLGDLKASREFLFVLENGGENPITDVTLTTNNPNFEVSPENISTINGTSSMSGGIIPLISLGVVHGVNLNGIGYTDLLSMGEHSAVLTITGKTVENGEAINLQSEFEFNANAKVMDFTVFDESNEIDFSTPGSIFGSTNIAGLSTLYGYAFPSGMMTINNTGNVPIKITARDLDIPTDPGTEITILPNQSGQIELNPARASLISVDGGGTISNHRKFMIGNDGKIYFGA